MVDTESNDGQLLELALFAGAGGGILGGKLLGWRTICAVEINPYAASVLAARQNDGCLEGFPIWSDIRSFRPTNPACREMFAALRAVRHRLVISGGFPCQDISVAGKGAGLGGERSGLWGEQSRIIRQIRPRLAYMENSPALTGRGLDRILADLAALGFDAEWGVLGASDTGADHERQRIWIAACHSNPSGIRRQGLQVQSAMDGQARQWWPWDKAESLAVSARQRRFSTLANIPRANDGVANRMDRLAAIGNGQVPAVAQLAWKVLNEPPA